MRQKIISFLETMGTAPAIGIDLGTTNSCVALWDNGKSVIIPNAANETTTPSVVSFGYTGYSIGDGNNIGVVPINSEIFNAKRIFGANVKEANNIGQNSPFIFVGDAKNRPKYKVEFKGEHRSFYPEQISALVLRKMKKDAEDRLQKMVKKAVITVPAYFNDAQRQSTKVAAELAGLEIIKMIPEPVAATLAFGYKARTKMDRNVLVYDLGMCYFKKKL